MDQSPKDVDSIAEEESQAIVLSGENDPIIVHYLGREVAYNWDGFSTKKWKSIRIVLKGDLTPQFGRFLANSLASVQIESLWLFVYSKIICSVEDWAKILQIFKANHYEFQTFYLEGRYFKNEILRKAVHIEANCSLNDQQFLSLKAESLILTNIHLSAKGINSFLKEWRAGNREISQLKLELSLTESDLSSIIEDIDANPIWTPETHSISQISALQMAKIENPKHFYSLWRSNNIQEYFQLTLSISGVRMIIAGEEINTLFGLISQRQFYHLFGSCKFCGEENCRHIKSIKYN